MSMPKTYYCFMLVFSEDFSEVLLLTKMKGPAFLIGKLTGVGGKLEAGETAIDAAVREFSEEAGLTIPAKNWLPVAVAEAEHYRLDAFTATGDIHKAKTNLDEAIVEPVSVHKVADILAAHCLAPDTIAPDLKELILKSLAVHGLNTHAPSPD